MNEPLPSGADDGPGEWAPLVDQYLDLVEKYGPADSRTQAFLNEHSTVEELKSWQATVQELQTKGTHARRRRRNQALAMVCLAIALCGLIGLSGYRGFRSQRALNDTQARLQTQQEEHTKQIAALGMQHTKQIAALDTQHAKQIAALVKQLEQQKQEYASKDSQMQDRVARAGEVLSSVALTATIRLAEQRSSSDDASKLSTSGVDAKEPMGLYRNHLEVSTAFDNLKEAIKLLQSVRNGKPF